MGPVDYDDEFERLTASLFAEDEDFRKASVKGGKRFATTYRVFRHVVLPFAVLAVLGMVVGFVLPTGYLQVIAMCVLACVGTFHGIRVLGLLPSGSWIPRFEGRPKAPVND